MSSEDESDDATAQSSSLDSFAEMVGELAVDSGADDDPKLVKGGTATSLAEDSDEDSDSFVD